MGAMQARQWHVSKQLPGHASIARVLQVLVMLYAASDNCPVSRLRATGHMYRIRQQWHAGCIMLEVWA